MVTCEIKHQNNFEVISVFYLRWHCTEHDNVMPLQCQCIVVSHNVMQEKFKYAQQVEFCLCNFRVL